MYHSVYIVNVPIRSISGTHTITEEDLGLAPGTLPPDDLATLGALITVDRKLLSPIEKFRARVRRKLFSTGVKVGMGTVVTEPDLQPLVDDLKVLQDEFYAAKADLVASLGDSVTARAAEHPTYASLLRKHAPDVRYVERRLSFDIDIFKFEVPKDDPNADLLSKTLSRSGNDISTRLVREIADFVEDVHQVSFQKGRLVKHNLGPLRETLLPKIKSFQLLDRRLSAVVAHLEAFISDATAAIDSRPGGNAYLEGSQLSPFETRLNELRSTRGIDALMAAPPPSATPVARHAEQSQIPLDPPAASRALPRRTPSTDRPSGRRHVVAF